MLPSLTHSTSRQPRKWTPQEDHKLREEVEAQLMEGQAKDWCRIAANLPGRTNKDCRKRWHNSIAGGLKKGQWSKSEDRQLAKGVEQYGQRWTLVADVVHSRSADQCAKRWQQSLDPDLDHSEWRESDDMLLIEAVQRYGRHWKDIQHVHFPGRSKNCIKNRYTVLTRKYHNKGVQLPQRTQTPETSVSSHIPDQSDGLLGIQDDLRSVGTQALTPEWDDVCSTEGGTPGAVWDTPPPMAMEPTAMDHSPIGYANLYQPPTVTISFPDEAQWSWTSLPMDQTMVMHTPTANGHLYPQPHFDPYSIFMQTENANLSYHDSGSWEGHVLASSPSTLPVGSIHSGAHGTLDYSDQDQWPQHNYPYKY